MLRESLSERDYPPNHTKMIQENRTKFSIASFVCESDYEKLWLTHKSLSSKKKNGVIKQRAQVIAVCALEPDESLSSFDLQCLNSARAAGYSRMISVLFVRSWRLLKKAGFMKGERFIVCAVLTIPGILLARPFAPCGCAKLLREVSLPLIADFVASAGHVRLTTPRFMKGKLPGNSYSRPV
jgi:hypothetical protein